MTLVYGINHVTGGCYSFTQVAWPSGGNLPTDPCTGKGGSNAIASSSSASSSANNVLNNGGNATNLPGSGTTGGSGHPTTIPKSGPNYTIPGQGYNPGNPHKLPFTTLSAG